MAFVYKKKKTIYSRCLLPIRIEERPMQQDAANHILLLY